MKKVLLACLLSVFAVGHAFAEEPMAAAHEGEAKEAKMEKKGHKAKKGHGKKKKAAAEAPAAEGAAK